MKEWHKPKDKIPPQGKKILCMHKGDLYVAQRFSNYWFSIPFCDSKYAFYEEPELWQEIDFPNGLTGEMAVYASRDDPSNNNHSFLEKSKAINMDEFEKQDPVAFQMLIVDLLKLFKGS